MKENKRDKGKNTEKEQSIERTKETATQNPKKNALKPPNEFQMNEWKRRGKFMECVKFATFAPQAKFGIHSSPFSTEAS